MQKRCLIFILLFGGIVVFSISEYMASKDGVRFIELSVDNQLASLVSQSPALQGVLIGSKTRMHVKGNSPPFKGEIDYRAKVNDTWVDLLVYWSGDSTNCNITTIKVARPYSVPEVLWTNSLK